MISIHLGRTKNECSQQVADDLRGSGDPFEPIKFFDDFRGYSKAAKGVSA